MAQAITAFRDARGKIHETKDAALLVDIEVALGDGASTGAAITPGIAKLLAMRAGALIPILKEVEALPKPALKVVAK